MSQEIKTIEDLLRKQDQIQKQMSDLLIRVREANGIKNPFQVTKELNRSIATLRNIEKGIAFPTTKTLKELIDLYQMTPIEKDKALKLKRDMLKVRRQIKKARNN